MLTVNHNYYYYELRIVSWRCGRDYCSAKEIMSIADAMATNGMKEVGYEYINLDGELFMKCTEQ